MTKSTKIIAALGVAAGLGIAALPAGAIFADYSWPLTYPGATSANVEVELTVKEGIALGVSANKCTADSNPSTASSVESFTISDAGSCTMNVAGGTNSANGFTLSVATASGATPELVLQASGSPVANPTVKQKIAATAGELNASDDNKAGWNITGGKLTNHAVSSTAAPVMVTASPKQAEMEMTYNFATRSDQEGGTYKTNITYTIAKNNTAITGGDDYGTGVTPSRVYPTE